MFGLPDNKFIFLVLIPITINIKIFDLWMKILSKNLDSVL